MLIEYIPDRMREDKCVLRIRSGQGTILVSITCDEDYGIGILLLEHNLEDWIPLRLSYDNSTLTSYLPKGA